MIHHTHRELVEMMISAGADPELTLKTLDRINRNRLDSPNPPLGDLPDVDGERVIDPTCLRAFRISRNAATASLDRLGLPRGLVSDSDTDGGDYLIEGRTLREIGRRLLPLFSYGILNGGSATSYADTRKNEAFDREIFAAYRNLIEKASPLVTGLPKGITPGFYGHSLEPGPDFVELKMRALLLAALRYRSTCPSDEAAEIRSLLFQMTSVSNDEAISHAYTRYARSPYLAPLVAATGIDITQVPTGVQPMIASFTHSSEGHPRRVFTTPKRGPGILVLPGGHGQCFEILKPVLEMLYAEGKRFIQIGNVDNLGNTVDEIALAILALSGRGAGFEFSYRTPVDVKGGILVETPQRKLTCGDIGPAVSFDDVLAAEAQGKRVLFNCATGLFDLERLLADLDRIIDELPLRLSDQDKDLGKYSQAEQITWEVIGLLDEPLVFAVEKSRRFLAAKLLAENFLTSGIYLDRLAEQTDESTARIVRVAGTLHEGLVRKLVGEYGLRFTDDSWRPDGSILPAGR